MESEVTEDDFTRDPALELEAVKRLHYSVAEVKRKTIHALKKELAPPPPPHRSDASPKSASPASTSSKSTDVATTGSVAELKALLRAKLEYGQVMERDMDFDEDDLHDWRASIERLERQIEATNPMAVRWQRKQRKLKKLEEDGLLDAVLLQKWSDKQRVLKPK